MSGKAKIDEDLEFLIVKFKEVFELLKNVQLFWEERTRTCHQSTVRKIVNLSEQLEACHNVDLKRFPTKFPSDIKSKLLYKIQIALDEELRSLYETLKVLEEKQNEVKSACFKANKLYRQQSQHLKFSSVIQGTSTTPALSDMLDGIDEFQNVFIKDYLCRKIALKNFLPTDQNCVSDLKLHWKAFSIHESGSCHLNFMLNMPS